MTSFLVARLPSHHQSQGTIDFMQKKRLTFRLSNNFALLNVMETSFDHPADLWLSEEFKPGEEEKRIVERMAIGFESIKVKQEPSDDDLPMQSQPAVVILITRLPPHPKSLNAVEFMLENQINYRISSNFTLFDMFMSSGEFVSEEIGAKPKEEADYNALACQPMLNAVDLLGNVKEEPIEEDQREEVKLVKLGLTNQDWIDKNREGHSLRAHQPFSSNMIARLLFACPVECCPSSYASYAALEKHVMTHSKTARLFCDVCQMSFSNFSSGMEHIRKREENACCACGTKLGDARCLLVHHRLHTGEKPYVCEVCRERFAFQETLYLHSQEHTRWFRETSQQQMVTELPHQGAFRCHLCRHTFSRQSYLDLHKRSHNNERFLRSHCNKVFPKRKAFEKHQESRLKTTALVKEKPPVLIPQRKPGIPKVAPQKLTMKSRPLCSRPYSCKICFERFTWKESLIRHMNIIHK